MRSVRFYCQTIKEQSVLDPIESRHLSRVLRLPVGAAVELFDGRGTLAEGVVEQIHRNQVTVRATNISQIPPCDRGKIILAVSFAKGQRFDWLVEKCTELGADHIAAVQYEHTVKLGSAASLERLFRITISAAKQCGRLFLPKLTGPAKLKETVAALKADYPDSVLIYGSPDGKPLAEIPRLSPKNDTVVFIGPEGGFSEFEVGYLESEGSFAVSVNKNILRVETAAAAFCALLSEQQLS